VPDAHLTLTGNYVRLEPLEMSHVAGLVAAAREDPALYAWSVVPQGVVEMAHYVETARSWRSAGTALPFVAVRISDGAVLGSSRFFDIEHWPWPAGHSTVHGASPDCCEIGYTWLAASAVRTAVNTEQKLLMLTHAFENWRVQRVCFHTDVRNERSRNALTRIGARFEGVLRSHRLASDLTPRDSARFSIVAAEWPQLKAQLRGKLSAKPR
jgi:N-acetyltransferase